MKKKIVITFDVYGISSWPNNDYSTREMFLESFLSYEEAERYILEKQDTYQKCEIKKVWTKKQENKE